MKKKTVILLACAVVVVCAIVGVILNRQFSPESWKGKDTRFSVTVADTSKSGDVITVKTLRVLEDGSFKSYTLKRKGEVPQSLTEQAVGKLSDKELEDLFKFVVRDNRFLSVNQDPNEKVDPNKTGITVSVTCNGVTKSVHGKSAADSEACQKIKARLSDIEKAFSQKGK
ncbi:MAG TPA: hypothetical protein VF941_14205 [Clostridia bacterium]